jgi:hypothetical protein
LEQEKKLKGLWVDLSGIDERPGPCCMSFGFDLNPLVRSIAKVGLINQPFVARKDKGRIQVVAGYRRLLALKKLQRERVLCWDLSHLSLGERVLFNFYDNHATRGFNDVEISMVLSRMVTQLSKEAVLREYMPLLGLPSHEEILDRYLVLESLEHPIKVALVQKAFSFRALRPLLDTDADTRQTVFHWMLHFKFNFNQQLQVIEYILDLCEKENKKARALLEEEDFGTLVKDARMNTPQKAKQVVDRLRARCHPALTRAEQVFRTRVSQLGLPDGAVIKHPPFFEDPHYRLDIAFRNGKGLTGKLRALLDLEGLQNIGDPWSEDS